MVTNLTRSYHIKYIFVSELLFGRKSNRNGDADQRDPVGAVRGNGGPGGKFVYFISTCMWRYCAWPRAISCVHCAASLSVMY
jgi:hypothetical protein